MRPNRHTAVKGLNGCEIVFPLPKQNEDRVLIFYKFIIMHTVLALQIAYLSLLLLLLPQQLVIRLVDCR